MGKEYLLEEDSEEAAMSRLHGATIIRIPSPRDWATTVSMCLPNSCTRRFLDLNCTERPSDLATTVWPPLPAPFVEDRTRVPEKIPTPDGS